jgi:hypothetical protein
VTESTTMRKEALLAASFGTLLALAGGRAHGAPG